MAEESLSLSEFFDVKIGGDTSKELSGYHHSSVHIFDASSYLFLDFSLRIAFCLTRGMMVYLLGKFKQNWTYLYKSTGIEKHLRITSPLGNHPLNYDEIMFGLRIPLACSLFFIAAPRMDDLH